MSAVDRLVVTRTITTGAAVLVLNGASGFGKKHLVCSVIKEHNDNAKRMQDRRILHIFTPDSISTKKSKNMFKQLLSNKDITGRMPVLMLTQFHGFTSDLQQEVIDKLFPPSKYTKHAQRLLANRRNPVIILTDGTQEKYNPRVSRLLSSLQSIILDIPSFKNKKDAVDAFSLKHQLNIPDSVGVKIAGSCRNFHVLKIKLHEMLHRGDIMIHQNDCTITRDRFFEHIRSLRVPTKSCHNLAQTDALLEKLGESREFALKTLQLNPPTYQDLWKYTKTSKGCDKRELLKTAAEQLAQHKDAFSELDTMPLYMQEEMQGVTIRSTIINCNIVNERFHKLNFPSQIKKEVIVSSLESLKNEYAYDTNMTCSTTAALERYGIMKTAYNDQKDSFIPLQRPVNHDPDMTVALNAKIRCNLLVLDKVNNEKEELVHISDVSLLYKPKKTHVRKRKHQLQTQLTNMFATTALPASSPSPSPSSFSLSFPSGNGVMPKRLRQL